MSGVPGKNQAYFIRNSKGQILLLLLFFMVLFYYRGKPLKSL